MTACGADQAANLAKGVDFRHRARELDADLALFPEMWNIGYTFFDPNEPGARAPSGVSQNLSHTFNSIYSIGCTSVVLSRPMTKEAT